MKRITKENLFTVRPVGKESDVIKVLILSLLATSAIAFNVINLF